GGVVPTFSGVRNAVYQAGQYAKRFFVGGFGNQANAPLYFGTQPMLGIVPRRPIILGTGLSTKVPGPKSNIQPYVRGGALRGELFPALGQWVGGGVNPKTHNANVRVRRNGRTIDYGRETSGGLTQQERARYGDRTPPRNATDTERRATNPERY